MSLVTTHLFDDDQLRKERTFFGVFGSDETSINTALALQVLQHSEQQTAAVNYLEVKRVLYGL